MKAVVQVSESVCGDSRAVLLRGPDPQNAQLARLPIMPFVPPLFERTFVERHKL